MRRPRQSARRKRRSGFTLIEVMVSLGVMTIGAMAILALQAHTIRSNRHARQLTVAMQIAQRWVERFKQDAHTWTQVAPPSGTPSAAFVLQNTRYLSRVTTQPNAYQVIPNVTATVSNAFDFMGNDVANDDSEVGVDPNRAVVYCAAFRPAWVYFGRTMRVDVRVWWARAGTGRILDDFQGCGGIQSTLDPGPTGTFFNSNAYHVVYLPSVIRVTPLVR
jgi:type IV pilus modification protein PilV